MKMAKCVVCDTFGCCSSQEQHTYKDDCLCAPKSLQPVKISTYHKAFLVVTADLPQRELGTICQVKPSSSWTAYKGIGNASTFAGNAPTKEEALALLNGYQA
jgi:hypothetical protein